VNYERIIAGWLTDFSALTAGNAPIAESKTKIAAMTAAISGEFPLEAFTRQSLMEISRKFKFFPSHAELHEALTEWWDSHKPRPLAIGGPDDDTLSAEDRQWVIIWQRHKAGNWGAAKDGTPYLGSSTQLKNELYRMKRCKPAAFKWIVLNDREAARIAALAGWDDDTPERARTEEERKVARVTASRAVAEISAR
jgi:hypothetical protein